MADAGKGSTVVLGKTSPQHTKPRAVWGAHFDPSSCLFLIEFLWPLAHRQAEADISGSEEEAEVVHSIYSSFLL